MRCVYCGEENPEGKHFCGKCGTSLADPDTDLYGSQARPYAVMTSLFGGPELELSRGQYRKVRSIYIVLYVIFIALCLAIVYYDLGYGLISLFFASLIIVYYEIKFRDARERAEREWPRIPVNE